MGNIIIDEEKLQKLLNENIELNSSNVKLKLESMSLKNKLHGTKKENSDFQYILKHYDEILNDYEKNSADIISEILKLKKYITENFNIINDIPENLNDSLNKTLSRNDLSTTFVNDNGDLFFSESIFDISIFLLKQLKKLNDMGYSSFLPSNESDDDLV